MTSPVERATGELVQSLSLKNEPTLRRLFEDGIGADSWFAPAVFVVIPVFNRRKLTQQCLESLSIQTYRSIRIVVVDHGSTDGTAAMMGARFPRVTLIREKEDLWWTGATNAGVRWSLGVASKSDYILTLNNDTVAPPSYVSRLVGYAASHQNAIIGSVAVDANRPDTIIEAGVNIDWVSAKFRYPLRGSLASRLDDDVEIAPMTLPGRGTLVPVPLFRRLGLFDEQTFPHYGADYDFVLRARRCGVAVWVAPKATVATFPRLSGLACSDEKVTLGQLLQSLFSIRSGNQIGMRLRFALRHCPKRFVASFACLDFARVIVGGLLRRVSLRGDES